MASYIEINLGFGRGIKRMPILTEKERKRRAMEIAREWAVTEELIQKEAVAAQEEEAYVASYRDTAD